MELPREYLRTRTMEPYHRNASERKRVLLKVKPNHVLDKFMLTIYNSYELHLIKLMSLSDSHRYM